MRPRAARRCLRCRGRGGWFTIHDVPPGTVVEGFNPIGGFSMLLHFTDGGVGSARWHKCPTCHRDGLILGTAERTDDVLAWAEAVGFRWPDAKPRMPEPRAEAAGCIKQRIAPAAG